MVNFPIGKVHNAYIIETYNYESTKRDIMNYAILNGFDKNVVYSLNHPDICFFEIVDKKKLIENIRSMIVDASNYSPQVADRKFYIIYDAVELDNVAQTTLLKTLEEPKEFDTFFLVTSNANKLLDTIKSRCIMLSDTEEDDYKKLLDIDFLDDAIKILANIKYENVTTIMAFADNFDQREDKFLELIKIYRYVIRDALVYKKTLTKDFIYLREKEQEIISVANSLTYKELGVLCDNLDKLSAMKGLPINKKIAVYNFYKN